MARAQLILERFEGDTPKTDFWPKTCLYVSQTVEQAIDWAEHRAQQGNESLEKNSTVPAVFRFVSATKLDSVHPHYEFKTSGTTEVEKRVLCNYIAACRKYVSFGEFIQRVKELNLPINQNIEWISGPMLLNPAEVFENFHDGRKELPKDVLAKCALGGEQICSIGGESNTYFEKCEKQLLVWDIHSLKMLRKRLRFPSCNYVQQGMDVSKNEVKEKEEKDPFEQGFSEKMHLDQ